jgi:hypothetical protein
MVVSRRLALSTRTTESLAGFANRIVSTGRMRASESGVKMFGTPSADVSGAIVSRTTGAATRRRRGGGGVSATVALSVDPALSVGVGEAAVGGIVAGAIPPATESTVRVAAAGVSR